MIIPKKTVYCPVLLVYNIVVASVNGIIGGVSLREGNGA
jgi:hypothetical protein